MKHLISWVEIPATNFERAITFYKQVLGQDITEMDMFGTKMGLFASDSETVSGAIVQGEGYTPSTEGPLVYLNGGEDLQAILDKVEPNHGKVIVAKTQISPEMGYFGLFIDTEGNKMGLHSMN